MSGACGQRLPRMVDPGNIATVNTIDVHAQSLLLSNLIDASNAHEFLTNVPRKYRTFANRIPPEKTTASPVYNSDLPAATKAITRFDWAMYLISSNHFVSSIAACNFSFHVTLISDLFSEGQTLFGEFTECKSISNVIKELYDHVCSSGDYFILSKFMIRFHCLLPGELMKNLW